MPVWLVQLPLGLAEVALERARLELGDRGGFEARWLAEQGQQRLELEPFRQRVRSYLREVYRQRQGREPPTIPLNLASHQLVDDVLGWMRLNPPTNQVSGR